MKIALIVQNTDIGGVTNCVLNLGDQLKRAGHEVTVVVLKQDAGWPQIAAGGLRGLYLPSARWDSRSSYARRLARRLTQERFELLFINNGPDLHPVHLGLSALPDSMAIVPIAHNHRRGVYEQVSLNALAWNVAVGVSPQVQETLAARLPSRSILYLPNGIPLPPKAELARRAGWELPLRLLYAGQLEERQKNVRLLPDILSACRRRGLEVRLTVMGDGPDRGMLETLLAQAGLSHLVDMRGFQPHPTVYQAMQMHHILLLPTHFEGLPLVLLEAQANGCVPMATRLPNSTDAAIAEGVTGLLVAPGHADGFAEGIARLQAPAQWQAYSQAGRERARQLFSTEVMGERYLQLVEELRQGRYPLPKPRSALPSPFAWKDYLPMPLRYRLARLNRLKTQKFPVSQKS